MPLYARANQTFLPTLLQVRNIVKKMQREMWSTPTDALDFVASLIRTPGCFVDWDDDSLHRLKMVFWSTAEQQILARQYGGVVIQDNTCLTNRCEFSHSGPGSSTYRLLFPR